MIYSFIYNFSVKGETKKTFEGLSPPGGFVQRMCIFTFCLTNICKIRNIGIDRKNARNGGIFATTQSKILA